MFGTFAPAVRHSLHYVALMCNKRRGSWLAIERGRFSWSEEQESSVLTVYIQQY